MDQCTHEVRLQYWKNIISLCHERPSGQTAKQWLKENGICEQKFLFRTFLIPFRMFQQKLILPIAMTDLMQNLLELSDRLQLLKMVP